MKGDEVKKKYNFLKDLLVGSQNVEYRGWWGREWSMADEGHHMEDDGVL